jgi:hypothetical protein
MENQQQFEQANQQLEPEMKKETNKQKILFGVLLFVFVIIVVIIFKSLNKEGEPVVIEPEDEKQETEFVLAENASPITALPCDNKGKRAFAVMYSDIDHAYMSGLSQADFVLEMPHRPMHEIPRIMGVFQCNLPQIIGPMRSGRTDHISVAGSLDAIFVPWGGSSVGKQLLKKGVIDHIDCNGEVAPAGGYPACFRREGPMSHLSSASSNPLELIKVAQANDYRLESQTATFPHQADLPLEQRPEYGKVRAKFNKDGYVAEYLYDKQSNSYKRYLFGDPSIDYENKEQHAPKNLITIITKKDSWLTDTDYVAQGLLDPWDGIDEQHRKNDNNQYPNMQLGDPWFDTKYEGEAEFFINGQQIEGSWKREKGLDRQFQFFDSSGQQIKFVPGQIWMHVLSHSSNVTYEDQEEYNEKLKEQQEANQEQTDSVL